MQLFLFIFILFIYIFKEVLKKIVFNFSPTSLGGAFKRLTLLSFIEIGNVRKFVSKNVIDKEYMFYEYLKERKKYLV